MRVGVEGARGARVRNAVDQRRINELITHALISEHGLADLVAKVTEAESVCVQHGYKQSCCQVQMLLLPPIMYMEIKKN